MSVSTAIKAVDKYVGFHNEKHKRGIIIEPSITFYGGEPFLKFEIIKSVVNYCKSKNFKAKIYATTNGTIINDEIIDFIIENEIHVMFSLDGYKENHDRNRVFANNIPTFELILENIKKIQKKKKKAGKRTIVNV
jgi:uncharacterized protein